MTFYGLWQPAADQLRDAGRRRMQMSIPIDRREFLRVGLLAASAQLVPLRSWSFTPQATFRFLWRGHSFSGAATLLMCAHLRCITCGVDVLLSTHRFHSDALPDLAFTF